MSAAPRDRVLAFFDGTARWLAPALEPFADDTDAVVAAARARFEPMIDELPYVDRPEHTMATSMFACGAMLAVFEVLRERGVDTHAFGRAIHTLPAILPGAADDDQAKGQADAAASQRDPAANEFVFELVDGDTGSDRGMNVTWCAICHLYGKHDAMELVPYMCAFDDVMSDAGDQGLRRTGTIALGAKRCDFRFRQGGEPLRLAEQYPERIRLTEV